MYSPAVTDVHLSPFKSAQLPLPHIQSISPLALTSLVKIAIIFLPLIAHSIQQIASIGLWLMRALRWEGCCGDPRL